MRLVFCLLPCRCMKGRIYPAKKPLAGLNQTMSVSRTVTSGFVPVRLLYNPSFGGVGGGLCFLLADLIDPSTRPERPLKQSSAKDDYPTYSAYSAYWTYSIHRSKDKPFSPFHSIPTQKQPSPLERAAYERKSDSFSYKASKESPISSDSVAIR